MTTTYKTHYARIDVEELQLLEKYKCSGTVTRVYLALKSFAREKQFCWPNLNTIAEILGITTKSAIQTVSKALAQLVKLGIIIKNKPTSKKRFFMKAQNEIVQNRQVKVSENGNRTETKNNNILINKQINKNIIYKRTNKAPKHRLGGFNGGINESYTDSDLPRVEHEFSKAIEQKYPLTIDQINQFQQYMDNNEEFTLWVKAFHSDMWQKIMNIRLTDDEIECAMKKWSSTIKIPEVESKNENIINKFGGGVFSRLLRQTKWT